MDYCPTQGGTFRAYPPFTAATVAKPRPVAPAEVPLTDEKIWADEGIMAINAEAGLPLNLIVKFVRATERAHGIGERP